MKKRTNILLVLLMALLTFSLTACGGTSANETDKSAIELANFKFVDGKDALVYDLDTRVIYYMFSTYECTGYQGFGYGYLSPYISENGHFCRYINDEIVEITDDTTNK